VSAEATAPPSVHRQSGLCFALGYARPLGVKGGERLCASGVFWARHRRAGAMRVVLQADIEGVAQIIDYRECFPVSPPTGRLAGAK
jgi:hypothetical protein